MKIKEIVNLIENFAPLESQEEWDGSGWQVYYGEKDIKKVLVCLTLSKEILKQAINQNCEMIISHHPFIFPHAVPLEFNKNIPIYSAHTNLDKASGGTTDTLINLLGFDFKLAQKIGDFLRIVDLQDEIDLCDFISKIKSKLDLKNVRVVNNLNVKKLSKLAFCAGSGTEFLRDAKAFGANVLVTGDVKYHTAVDSDVIIIDVGHFESERPVLKTLEKMLLENNLGVVIADEKSPFINY